MRKESGNRDNGIPKSWRSHRVLDGRKTSNRRDLIYRNAPSTIVNRHSVISNRQNDTKSNATMTPRRWIRIPKQIDNPIDIAILLTMKYGRSVRTLNRVIDKRIDDIQENDIVSLSVETLQWNLVRAFVEDMAQDKARLLIKRLKTI